VIEGAKSDVIFDTVRSFQEISIVNIVVVEFILILIAHDVSPFFLIKIHSEVDSLHIGFNNRVIKLFMGHSG
jgi:hypothetical protein